MKINDEYTVKIEKLTNEGAGLAKIDDFVIFIKDVCPLDTVKIKLLKINKTYAIGEVIDIVEKSPFRIEPFCPMQKVCGACQIQFIDYNYQTQLKTQITKETLKSISGIDFNVKNTIPSPQTKNYRHKIQYPLSQTKNSKRLLAGYYKPKSHEIVNIKYCPIQPEICDKIIDFIRQEFNNLNISTYNEKTHKGELRHVVLRHSALNGKTLVALVLNGTQPSEEIKKLAKSINEAFEEVCGVCINFNNKKNNVILGDKNECVCGQDFIEENILGIKFKIGVNTFFQVNPKSAENIFRFVKDYIKNNFDKPVLLDAYAGISAFGLCMADVCEKVISVEENIDSCKLAKEVAIQNNIQNIEINNMDAGKFFAKQTTQFDVIILDPPRKGCSQLSLDEAYRLCKDTIIYVSCNPATLARDLKYLIEQKGCSVKFIQPFDMFCHTYHIENVAIIKVNK